MKKYFVRFECRSRTRLESLQSLQQDKRFQRRLLATNPQRPSLVFYDSVMKSGDVFLPDGLGIDSHIESASIDEAIRECGFVTAFVVNGMTFATGAEASIPQFVIAYDATGSSTERQLKSATRLPPSSNARQLEPELADPIIRACFELLGKAQTSKDGSKEHLRKFDRIDRALKWFRKGIGETAVIDEFTAYWTALETLDPLIKPERRVPSLVCKECGNRIDKCNGDSCTKT